MYKYSNFILQNKSPKIFILSSLELSIMGIPGKPLTYYATNAQFLIERNKMYLQMWCISMLLNVLFKYLFNVLFLVFAYVIYYLFANFLEVKFQYFFFFCCTILFTVNWQIKSLKIVCYIKLGRLFSISTLCFLKNCT